MFCKIELFPKKVIENDEVEDLLWTFLNSLRNSGRILKKYSVVEGENYTLYVTLPKEDSFEEKYDNIYVKRDRAKIKKLFDYKLTVVGQNVECSEYCCCKSRSAIEMQTYFADINSIFTCCDCGKAIALYEVPYLDKQDDHYYLLSWQENFAAMDRLWYNGTYERYAAKQLVDPTSKLNKDGLEIAKQISSKMGCKVYYNIFDCLDFGKKIKFDDVDGIRLRVCPICGKTMKRKKFLEDYKVDVCEECSLTSECYKN
ncbi:MAG: hypothetical protein E7627_07555 [Ruminococcaceae bacterium]|nr:hypothetical protein [Oscillospiraceae bacterium]